MNKQLNALEKTFGKSSIVQIKETFIVEREIELYLKRDDCLHPIISGNKWRKLKYILEHALSMSTHTIISMGGAYSNHLHALAYTGKILGIKTVGMIRGEQPKNFSATLKDLQNWGMQLNFVSRSEYRQLREYKQWDSLPQLKLGEYWLPEGGAMVLALQGIAELVDEIDIDYDCLCVPCGTATTLAGLICAAPQDKKILGFPALKGAGFLIDDVNNLINKSSCHNNEWFVHLDYHFGGFAKQKPELLQFIEQFEDRHSIPLEPIYTGKMLYGIYDLIHQGYFQAGQKIIAVHTGGLQGNRSRFKE
ncbi:MAG: pyridoxal-phosphate dependent enzyme [Methyloprofundus sp.]|nr:pyridoxal-phosphate dependent enzyme [Methyloprofundus sp.]